MRRVGVLLNAAATEVEHQGYLAAFVAEMRRLGWSEGQNLRLDVRWTAGDAVLSHTYAVELIRPMPDVIVAASSVNLAAVEQATKTIPIVFVGVADPLTQGFVSNMRQPGGNVTGFSMHEFSLGGKWLETAARSLKVVPTTAPARSDGEIETAIIALGREPGGGLVVIPDVFMTAHRAPIISAARRKRSTRSTP